MKKASLWILTILMIVSNLSAADFYVSANASGNGNGSLNSPWKLQEAMSSPLALMNPVDTVWIWILEGNYTNNFDSQTSFNCFTNGKPNAPIIFRNYKNQKVVIDGDLPYTIYFAFGNCSYTWLWGLEILNSSTKDRDHSNIDRLGNIACLAENIKFINLIVHDLGSGLDLWKTSKNSESYGCIIYNIGNNLSNNGNWEGHGHGMYLQNDTFGVKNIHDNIIFNAFGYGVKVWQTTTASALGNFDIQRNIVFNSGAPSENLGGVGNNYRTHNFFVVTNGQNNPVKNTVIKHNLTYSGTNTPRPPVNAFGLNFGVKNMTLDSNVLTGQLRLGYNNTPVFDATVQGNTIVAGIPTAYGYYLWGFLEADFIQNTYIPTPLATGLEYFIYPNKYEAGRSHLAVYNWDGDASVAVDISESGLQSGDIFELVNVMDYHNDIITDTLSSSGIIAVNMQDHSFSEVIGSQKNSVSQFPFFGAFVIRKIGETSTTGISEIKNNTQLNIFPNPTSNGYKLSFLIARSGFYDVTLTDIVGKTTLIQRKAYFDTGNQEIQMDPKDLENGIYFIRIEGQQSVFNGKLVLNK